MKLFSLAFAFFLTVTVSIQAQAEDASAQARSPSALQALAVYPAAIRQATIGALGYPGTLLQLAQIQSKTSAAFQTLLAPVPQDSQKQLWQLLRYPRLVEDLAAFGPQVGKAARQAAAAFPKDLRPAAADLVQNRFELLQKTSALNRQATQELSQALQPLPAPARQDFQTLADHSEIFHILNQNLRLKDFTPESFRKDPKPLTQRTQALVQRLQQLPTAAHPEQWQGASHDDPKAVAALQKAARQFERQNDAALDEDPNPKGAVQANVGFTPYASVFVPVGWAYPFWFGWPGWDPYPYW